VSKLRVAVLMGGTSSEREISLSTGRQIMAALDPAKYDTLALDAAALSPRAVPPPAAAAAIPSLETSRAAPAMAAPDGAEVAAIDLGAIARPDAPCRPDVVLIALHGRGGEDGTVQGLLELLGIPYTGSGVLASALAIDKAMTKRVLRGEGIPVPPDVVLLRSTRPAANAVRRQTAAVVGFPAIVKPNREGSTIGCTIVRDPEDLGSAIDEAFRHDDTVLIEQYLTGTEITVGLLGNTDPVALPTIEIVPEGGFYDYRAKYAQGGSQHVIPARISGAAAGRARDYALRCHRALGCRGMSRVDMIVVDDQPYVLEVNTIPGMTPTSLLPDAARAAGIPFGELLDRLIALALD
jgi:D-alanine-D-alanine ligase